MATSQERTVPSLHQALGVCEEIVAALRVELARNHDLGSALARLDGDAILGFVSARNSFLEAVGQLQERLSTHLSLAGRALGLREVTVASLAAKTPEQAEALARAFATLRELTYELKLRDDSNKELLDRGLAVVNSYLAAMRPSGAAYDRRGAAPTAPVTNSSTFSRRV